MSDLPSASAYRGQIDLHGAESLDTTIFGIANGVSLFANHPEQWDLVRAGRVAILNLNTSYAISSDAEGSCAG